MNHLLEIENLAVEFQTLRGDIKPVRGISFHVDKGEVLGIVGESGCGKSITSLATMGLLPETAKITADHLKFNDQNLLKLSESKYQKLRGSDMAMIFQDPMTSLNPSFTVGYQIIEALKVHQKAAEGKYEETAVALLREVGIPSPEERLQTYPHQLSGGMSQRVMIAMSIACRPKLLIADEPTTALDVTIQAQILQLLKKLQKETDMALILITHDIGVVAEMSDRLLVMYAGEIVESGPTRQIIENPRHPYTEGLLACLPGAHTEKKAKRQHLPTIPGLVPDLANRPNGCQMHPRCKYAHDLCRNEAPPLDDNGHSRARCFFPLDGKGSSS